MDNNNKLSSGHTAVPAQTMAVQAARHHPHPQRSSHQKRCFYLRALAPPQRPLVQLLLPLLLMPDREPALATQRHHPRQQEGRSRRRAPPAPAPRR